MTGLRILPTAAHQPCSLLPRPPFMSDAVSQPGTASASFGEHLAALRHERRLTLRKFCVRGGFDAVTVGKLERGRIAIPEDALLERYAEALGLSAGTESWRTFFTLAARDRVLPLRPPMSDAEVAAHLPMILPPLSDAQYDRLIEAIRTS
jgi:transcriptional regulator with XRE-family HTH domain